MTFCKWILVGSIVLLVQAPGAQAQDAPAEAEAKPAEPAPPAPATAETEPVVTVPPSAAEPTSAPSTLKQATARVALPGPVAPAAEPAPAFPEWIRHVKLGGGAILYYYQPLKKHQKNNLSFFHGRIDVDVDVGAFGIHLEPRFRDGKLRPFFEGPAWIEEGYTSWTFGPFAKLKVGKLYSRLGLFWNNSFYGNVQVYDGLKLSPDYGASLEGTFGERIGLNYWAQFFLVDGRTNVSLADRDTVSVPGARRRNEVVLNLEPFIKLSETALLRAGVSLEHFKADLPVDADQVLRLAAHAKLTVGGFGAWGELLHQKGRHVTNFPIAGTPASEDQAAVPGRASGDNTYFEVGAEYTLASFTLRYNVSSARYADVRIREWMHVPAIAYKVADPITLQAELVIWRRHSQMGNSDVDKSLNVTLLASF